MQRDPNNSITEDTDMWRKRDNNQIKHPHVKYEISNRLAFIKVGAYYNASRFRSLPANYSVFYRSLYSLLISEFTAAQCVLYNHHPFLCAHKNN